MYINGRNQVTFGQTGVIEMPQGDILLEHSWVTAKRQYFPWGPNSRLRWGNTGGFSLTYTSIRAIKLRDVRLLRLSGMWLGNPKRRVLTPFQNCTFLGH